MSILSGHAIKNAIAEGDIEIDPFVDEHVNPASVDLTLGTMVRMYDNYRDGVDCLDCRRQETLVSNCQIDIGYDGFVLWPGRLYLMHTAERVLAKRHVPILDGKSSIGRLGVCVHLTAGFGDTGFNGQYTLEVTTVYPVRVYAGMRFAQIRFHTIEGEAIDYQEKGHYVGSASMGPVPSQVWKQFK
jgi:dCTP deaminase